MNDEGNRKDKIALALAHHAAEYFERESNRQSLITVTRAVMSTDSVRATIYLSVLPESAEAPVISFARRSRGELRAYLQKAMPSVRIPTIDVLIDEGEKNRQHIDELLR